MQAARFSIWAPVVAIIVNLATSTGTGDSRETKLVIGIICGSIILLGLGFSIYALISMRRHGKKGLLGYGIAGLIFNGLIVVSVVSVIPAYKKAAEIQNAGLNSEEASRIERVIEGSQVLFNERIGYRIEIPPGFVENPDARSNPIIEYAYFKPDADGTSVGLNIQNLRGRIRQEPLDASGLSAMKSNLPEGTHVEIITEKWNGFVIEGFLQRIPVEGGVVSVFGIQVPLSREAIQVNIGGPSDSEEEYRKLLTMVLESLHGQSNWRK